MSKTIRGGAREIIYKVFMQCLAEFQSGQLLTDLDYVYKRTADYPRTPSQLRCASCGATAMDFNKLDVVTNKSVNPETLRHRLSSLHARIRIFEFLLHLRYKNDPVVRKWRVTNNSTEAAIIEERKQTIQYELRINI